MSKSYGYEELLMGQMTREGIELAKRIAEVFESDVMEVVKTPHVELLERMVDKLEKEKVEHAQTRGALDIVISTLDYTVGVGVRGGDSEQVVEVMKEEKECDHKGYVYREITSDPLNPTYGCYKCGKKETPRDVEKRRQEKVKKMEEGKGLINNLCKEAYITAKSKGWHDEERELGTVLCLIHGEVSEAMEAARKNDMNNFLEELADVCIRVFDLCGAYQLNLENAISKKMQFNKTRPYKHGGKKF